MHSDQAKKLIATVIISVMIILFSAGAFWQFSRNMQNNKESLRDTLAKIAQLEEEKKAAQSAKDLLKQRSADLARIENVSVNRKEPLEFIEALETLGRDTKNLISLDFDESRREENRLFFRLTVEGTEQSARQYLKLLELMPYQIQVEDVFFQKFLEEGKTAPNFSKDKSKAPPSHRLTVLIKVVSK